jgi:hypothetical protein
VQGIRITVETNYLSHLGDERRTAEPSERQKKKEQDYFDAQNLFAEGIESRPNANPESGETDSRKNKKKSRTKKKKIQLGEKEKEDRPREIGKTKKRVVRHK